MESTHRLEDQPLEVHEVVVRVLRGDGRPDEYTSADARPVTIGSAPGNDVVLDDPAVSRFHLRLTPRSACVHVEDLRTLNGSRFGPARFEAVALEGPAEVRLGSSVLRIEPRDRGPVPTSPDPRFAGMFGRAPAMRRAFERLKSSARSRDLPVLLRGETGTGKELAARALHEAGPRAVAPFCVVNCAGLTPTLIESQLFGHEVGAFTGATKTKRSPFLLADGGTVFLDEVAEIPIALQSKLLRALQERRVQPVGASTEHPFDAKIVAATHRDLLEEINHGRFREDLYYRLAGDEIVLPPLRERPEDIPLLVDVFVDRILAADPDGITRDHVPQDVAAQLASRTWPGNVRELHNHVYRYLVHGELAPERRRASSSVRLDVDDLLELPLRDAVRAFERRVLRHALDGTDESVERTAARLGIDKSTLYRKLRDD